MAKIMNQLNAITPIDGRYRKQVEELANYFSEEALIRYRIRIEIEYFIALCELPLPQLENFPKSYYKDLRKIYSEFTTADAETVKDIEKTTNHDVKAVEYFIKRCFEKLNIAKYKEFIHFGLTSQDINNTSVPLSLKEFHNNVFQPLLNEVLNLICDKADEWKNIPMLAHTHGQPASPTILGKEIYVFVYRLGRQMDKFGDWTFDAKFGGATGNFNAHKVAYPQYDWIEFANNFIKSIGLHRLLYTTQIENYDELAAYFDTVRRINTILIDFCRDIWAYISMNYFKQRIKEGEVGSSAMPHKVNPIDFENAEGNLGLANAILTHLSMKLPISRLQRDLTDSTVSRNIGVPMAHSIIALRSIIKGVNKLLLNEQILYNDLEENWAVVAEALQTILRSINYPEPYETLKALTRTNSHITKATIDEFVNGLSVSEEIKDRMKAVTPHNYVGVYVKR
ncbi:MAG: adenylosuccinate lyase [Bacteroidales bacterium]|jgi:adenylosuccinate lyase|nr:adenylosuccinate lyase [Bacteroidales bacterium]